MAIFKRTVFCLLLAIVPFGAFAQTFVSLKPNLTQILVAQGAGPQIVGITKFCARPNATAMVVADYQTINVEAVYRLQPDFVLLSRENTQQKQFEQLKAVFQNSKTNVMVMDSDSLEEFYSSYILIGNLLDKPDRFWHTDRASYRVTQWQDDLKVARAARPDLEGKTFAVIIERQPLVVAGGRTFVSTLIAELGLKNAFEDNQIAYPTLTPDAFALTRADYVFDLSREAASGKKFLGKAVIPFPVEDFLAGPRSFETLLAWASAGRPQ